MKFLVDGLTCLMMLMIILLSSKILFPDQTEAMLNDVNTRWEAANEQVENEAQP